MVMTMMMLKMKDFCGVLIENAFDDSWTNDQ